MQFALYDDETLKRKKLLRNSEFLKWIRDLISANLIPIAYLLEEIDQTGDEKIDKRLRWECEQKWVRVLREQGEIIFNKKAGVPKGFKRGPSPLKGKPVSEKQRRILDKARDIRWAKHFAKSPEEQAEVFAHIWEMRKSKTPEEQISVYKKQWQTRRANQEKKL